MNVISNGKEKAAGVFSHPRPRIRLTSWEYFAASRTVGFLLCRYTGDQEGLLIITSKGRGIYY
jgi:hypothetical protein